MKIFGLQISRIKNLTTVDSGARGGGGWINLVRESFGGAWQSNITIDAPKNILAFSAVFACVTVIATDIAKLRIKLVERDSEGINTEVTSSPFLSVLKKPNRYQTRIKFVEQWVVSKLIYGNTYVLKKRDGRGIVTSLYILDANRVTVLVAENGDVYYQLSVDELSGLDKTITVPASEIIHDMMVSLWHPLVGVSPIYACGLSATMGNRIQSNSTTFFSNMSRPSGMLTAPGSISNEVALRLKEAWESNFSGGNVGRLAVLGDGMTYSPMTIPAVEAQLIEQLRWTVEDVARCFHMPLYKIGGPVPAGDVDSLNQTYYSDCLQGIIESMELCLDEGLGVKSSRETRFDLDGLLRMDQTAMVVAEEKWVKAGIKSPNEARRRANLPPVTGGDSPYLQQQNYSLEALAKRDQKEDPFAGATPAPDTSPADTTDPTEDTTQDDEEDAAEQDMNALANRFVNGLLEYA